MDGAIEAPEPQVEREVVIQDLVVGVLPRRVRPDEGEDRGGQQDDAAGGLGGDEGLDGAGKPVNPLTPLSNARVLGVSG